MGRDNQPKERQRRDLARKQGNRPPYPRLLIVCEDGKSAPGYFEEIRCHYRLSTAHVQVQPSQLGTAPKHVVEYARTLFMEGDPHRKILKRRFDRIYAVFDRDDHQSYREALSQAAALDGQLRNDEKEAVRFEAVPSVPCFELWLLLHYEDVASQLHRDEVQRRLRKHVPDYEKNGEGVFQHTRDKLQSATNRAMKLLEKSTAHDGLAPYTKIVELVTALCSLKR